MSDNDTSGEIMPSTGISVDGQERFWSKVSKTDSCWLWIASQNDAGYGQFYVRRGLAPQRAHRVAYELMVGTIPQGLVLDHICRVRHCVNPDRLEVVTKGENTRRGVSAERLSAMWAARTSCHKGHPYTPENTYNPPGSSVRTCRSCRKAAKARYNQRRKA